jgi:hypothetical protein
MDILRCPGSSRLCSGGKHHILKLLDESFIPGDESSD